MMVRSANSGSEVKTRTSFRFSSGAWLTGPAPVKANMAPPTLGVGSFGS